MFEQMEELEGHYEEIASSLAAPDVASDAKR